MSKDLISSVSAKIKNVFQSGNFQSRKDDGAVRVTTDSAREVEGKEAFPYGFYAKAKKGVVTVLCSGGSFDAVRILPVEDSDDAPELKEGEVAIYTSDGTAVIAHSDGTIEITNGDLDLGKLGAEIFDALLQMKTVGAPPQHTLSPDTTKAFTELKEKWKRLFGGS